MSNIVRYDTDGRVARITLNRPDVHNAFNEEVISELSRHLLGAQTDATVRLIVLQSEGKSFSAGGDLNWMKRAAAFSHDENLEDAKHLATLLRLIDHSPKPVLCRVQGAALGGGMGLVAASDIAIASEKAIFGLTEVRVGLIPAVISPYVVRALGERRARALFLTGERFPAKEAERIGLIHQVVPPEELDAAVERTIIALEEAAPGAQAACKELIRAISQKLPEEVADTTARFLAERRKSDEAREGITAFLEKRKPNW